ncbi:MAG: TldD/PmbA family protein [Pseudomonadota bacterium]
MTYLETRRHELRKRRILMVDGNLTQNAQTVEAGASARVYHDGYWGFASTNDTSPAGIERITAQARQNAQAMGRFGVREAQPMPGGSYRGEHVYKGRAAVGQNECVQKMSEITALCNARYPALKSTRVLMGDEHHTKRLTTSTGSEVVSSIQRALCYVTFTAEDADGSPVELMEVFSCKGSLADLDLSTAALTPVLDQLHQHVQAKCHAVPAQGGAQTVVMAPELAGMLAHEAMGHPCEADLVLGGAVTANLVGQRVASDLISMIDVAHTFKGEEVMIPVYADDEGTPSRDAVLIQDGILTGFMNSRETAARMGMPPTGSARAYCPSDEPLIRMRNTVIVPGQSKFGDMIAGVEDGYLLMKTANGQADSTTEFMFGITLAYEIRDGRLGAAVKDTTLSGSAIKVLQSVDAVSDDLSWNCSGYCGKKQPMVVSMGGPALRARAHLGGQ